MSFYKWYSPFVWNTVLIVLNVGLAIYYYLISKGYIQSKYLRKITWLYILLIVLFCAVRPIGKDGYADSQMYADWFLYAQKYGKPIQHRDIAFDYYQLVLSYVVNVRTFFVITSLFFMCLLLAIGKKINKEWYILVVPLFLCTEIYFGIMNVTLRNGLGMLLFICAFITRSQIVKFLLFISAILFHKSLIIATLLYYLVKNINVRIKYYLTLWFISIFVSILLGSSYYYLFKHIAFDFRFDYLIDLTTESYLYHQTGFRWDFLLVSLGVILYGLYYIYIEKFNNHIYTHLLKLYIILNTFWIFVMYANHTVRFFMLSWFLVPLIFGYPHLKDFNLNNNNLKYYNLILGLVIFSVLLYFKRLID